MRKSHTLAILCLAVLSSACPDTDAHGGLQEEKVYEDQIDGNIVRVTETVFGDHKEHRVMVQSTAFDAEHMIQITAFDQEGNWRWDVVELCAEYRCRKANLNQETRVLEFEETSRAPFITIDYRTLEQSLKLLETVIPRVYVKKHEVVGLPMYVESEQFFVNMKDSGMMGYVLIRRQLGESREINVDLSPLESNLLNKRTLSGVDKDGDGRFDQLRVWQRPYRGWNEVTRNHDSSLTWSSCELNEHFALLTEEEIADVERQLRDVLKQSGYVPR